MEGILTIEEAQDYDLPKKHPLQRHKRVAAYIEGVRSLGTDVSISPFGSRVRIDGISVHVIASGPLFGRRTLTNLAESADFIDYLRKYDLLGDNK